MDVSSLSIETVAELTSFLQMKISSWCLFYRPLRGVGPSWAGGQGSGLVTSSAAGGGEGAFSLFPVPAERGQCASITF